VLREVIMAQRTQKASSIKPTNPLDPDGDNPGHAPESGEPGEAGRQQGRIIEPDGETPGMEREGKGGDSDFESGRHGTK
jgi:hypothetical protein